MNFATNIKPKSVRQVVTQCKRQRIPHIAGEHVVYVGRPQRMGGGNATYNSVNGIFYGTTPTGVRFRSTERMWDRQTWMKQLRVFFHMEKQA